MIKKFFIIVSIGFMGIISPMGHKHHPQNRFNAIVSSISSNTKKIIPFILPSLIPMAEAALPSNTTAPYQDPALSTDAALGYLTVLGGFIFVYSICLCNHFCTCKQCFPDEEEPINTISNIASRDTLELDVFPSKFIPVPIGELQKSTSQPSITIDTHTSTPHTIASTESPKSNNQKSSIKVSRNTSTQALESPHTITQTLHTSQMEKLPVTDLPYDIGEILNTLYKSMHNNSFNSATRYSYSSSSQASDNVLNFDTRYAYGNFSAWAGYQAIPSKTITLSLLHYNKDTPKHAAKRIIDYVSLIDREVNEYCANHPLQLPDTHVVSSVPVSRFFWLDTKIEKEKLKKLDK